ncbi:MAG: HAMP domain-containing histidine kinase [Ruminococcus sp.]|jgi:signal transduction histidine kinase|nr:HAMP domain-containing histidine kinase [Ruminococcus sp.]
MKNNNPNLKGNGRPEPPLRRFINTFFSAKLEFRVRLFNVLALAGTAVAFFIGLSLLLTDGSIVLVLVDWASAALAFGLMVYAAKTQKYVQCYFITVFVIFLGLFPFLYFNMGGYRSGVTSAFLLSIVMTVFMLEKKAAYIIVSLELLVYSGCMAFSFFYPGLVTEYPNEIEVFIHNLVTFLVTAVSLAVISLVHFGMYNAQQKKLNEQNTTLEQANKTKTEFLTNASHEMRTPLTVVSVNIQMVMGLLKDIEKQAENADAEKLLINSQNEIMRLSRMVGGMLTLASMSENTDKQKLDLTSLMKSGIEMLRMNVESRGNTLKSDIEPGLFVFGNADLLSQVLTNLLQNARAYTENGTVTVTATKQGSEIAVTVSDTGTGIPPEFLPNVFDRGVSTGGTGFGLYLCKTVVESHGGRIWIESSIENGRGTSVCYVLPFYEGQFGATVAFGGDE